MKLKLGPSEGNSRAVIRWGKYLDHGIWITHPDLRNWQWRPSLRYFRLWLVDVHL